MYTLHIYRNDERILAIYAQDDTEYSAIYITRRDGGANVASDLADINGETWTKEQWLESLSNLLVLDQEPIVWHRVFDVPLHVLDKFNEWVSRELRVWEKP